MFSIILFRFSGSDMDHECLRTDGISSRYKNTAATTILPEYGCLIVSPANLWKRDPGLFQVPNSLIFFFLGCCSYEAVHQVAPRTFVKKIIVVTISFHDEL